MALRAALGDVCGGVFSVRLGSRRMSSASLQSSDEADSVCYVGL